MSESVEGAAPPEDSAPKRERARNLSPQDRAAIVVIGKAGSATAADTATRFGVSVKTVYRIWNGAGIKAGEVQDDITTRAKEKVIAEITSDAALHTQRIKEARDAKYKLGLFIHRLTQKTLFEGVKQSIPLAKLANDLKALQLASMAARNSAEEMFDALGIDPLQVNPDDVMPELPIVELSPEQIRLMQARSREKDAEIPNMDYLADDRVIEEDGEIIDGRAPEVKLP